MEHLQIGDKVQLHGQVLKLPTKNNTAVRIMLVPSKSKLLFLKQDVTRPIMSGLWENAPITKAVLDPHNGVLPQMLPAWVPWKAVGKDIYLDVPNAHTPTLVGRMEDKDLAHSVAMEHNSVLLRVQQPGLGFFSNPVPIANAAV